MNEWNRISGIFARPRPVFEDLRERPRWLLPLIFVVVFLLAQAALIFALKIGFADQIQMLREQGRIPAEQMVQVEKTLQGPLPLIFGTVSVLVLTPVSLLIVALLLNIFVPLLGGEASFSRAFAVVCFAGLVRIPALVIKTVLMVIKGSTAVYTSLILLFPFIPHKGFFFNLLSRIDFFTIWELLLISLGLSITTQIRGKKTYFIVFGIWLGFLILTSALQGMGFGMRAR
jgi:hypothetical protein